MNDELTIPDPEAISVADLCRILNLLPERTLKRLKRDLAAKRCGCNECANEKHSELERFYGLVSSSYFRRSEWYGGV